MNQRRNTKIPDPTPLVTKHLQALRRSPDYQRLLNVATRACRTKGSLPEDRLGKVADAILRPIADDLSACCPGSRVIIFHMMVVNRGA